MRTFAALLAVAALASSVLAGEDYGKHDYGKGKGTDVLIKANEEKHEKEKKVSLKEVCYRDLYANVEEFKKEFEKEVKINDDKGKDVFIFDGFKKDENDVEFYFREFCYKEINFKAHEENVDKDNIIKIDDDGKGKKFYKRGEDYGKKDFHNDKGKGTDVLIKAEEDKHEKEKKVSLKEVCYRDLYANVEEFKKEFEKEVKINDDKGKDVFIFDGFKKDENDVEFYFREFCYKEVNVKAHEENVDKDQILKIDDDGKGKKFYKRGQLFYAWA
ncbi:hypothetical protein JCM10207_004528 [Rhodosporidiobolus poonsookiae]